MRNDNVDSNFFFFLAVTSAIYTMYNAFVILQNRYIHLQRAFSVYIITNKGYMTSVLACFVYNVINLIVINNAVMEYLVVIHGTCKWQ